MNIPTDWTLNEAPNARDLCVGMVVRFRSGHTSPVIATNQSGAIIVDDDGSRLTISIRSSIEYRRAVAGDSIEERRKAASRAAPELLGHSVLAICAWLGASGVKYKPRRVVAAFTALGFDWSQVDWSASVERRVSSAMARGRNGRRTPPELDAETEAQLLAAIDAAQEEG